MDRLDYFIGKKHLNRFWWFQRNDYLPPLYADLSEAEFALLVEWFEETERLNWIGECNVPAMSAMLGFIAGNGIDAIVQCGHYAGYSSLLMGWMLRRMGKQRALFSIDINAKVTQFTLKWIKKAGLADVVGFAWPNGDSGDPFMPYFAEVSLQKEIKMVFIDSSHQYEHTLKELDLWYGALVSGGFIFLHDVSKFSQQYDATGKGGVFQAMEEWSYKHKDGWGSEIMMINGTSSATVSPVSSMVYQDGCGLGVIQK